MAWQKLKGWKGKVYIPERSPVDPKHRCKDCLACQQCSAERCAVCRSQAAEKSGTRRAPKDPGESS